MTPDLLDDLSDFRTRLRLLLRALDDESRLLFALSVCEHMRGFVGGLASVAPILDSTLHGWWDSARSSTRLAPIDDELLEESVVSHMDRDQGGEASALGFQANAGLGFCIALVARWAERGDLEDLDRLAWSAVGELADVSAAESSEVEEMFELAGGLSVGDLDVAETRRRAMAHGEQLARLARTCWEG